MLDFVSSLLRYIRLKTAVSFLRLSYWYKVGQTKSFPDSIFQIPSRDARRFIKANVYQPRDLKGPSPVLVNFHGSGFIFRLHGHDDEFCRKMSNEARYTVLDIKYRLAPENPFPACTNDAEDVVNWILKQPDRFDLSRLSISGFSAGANISLVTSSMTFPKNTFRSLICFYPPTDFTLSQEDKLTTIPDPTGKPISARIANLFDASYVPVGQDPADPRLSVRYAPVDNYPQNVMLITCAHDGLCFEGEEVAAKIEEAGGERNFVRRRMEKCNHAWDKTAIPGTPQGKLKDEAYDLAVQMLKA